MNAYWINHGAWYDAERAANCISAPTRGDNGERVYHWTVLAEMQPGDLTVHCVRGMIRAVGTVERAAEIGPRPYDRPGHARHPSVYTVAIRYFDLAEPLPLTTISHDDRVAEGRLGPYRVFNKNGLVNQIYCGAISDRIVEVVRARIVPGGATEAPALGPEPDVAPARRIPEPPAVDHSSTPADEHVPMDDQHPAFRAAIDRHALRVASAHFQARGWTVRDVSREQPFTLLCTKPSVPDLHVLVKGTAGSSATVFLTPAEVEHARAKTADLALVVMSNVKVDARGGTPIAAGGDWRVIGPWDIERGTLRPVQYAYSPGRS